MLCDVCGRPLAEARRFGTKIARVLTGDGRHRVAIVRRMRTYTDGLACTRCSTFTPHDAQRAEAS